MDYLIVATSISVIRIPLSEFELSYARSSGPGGQNVNKVNSKAILRWSLIASPSLPLEIRAYLISRLRNKLNSAGELIISSDRFRDQIRNREDCFEKFQELLTAAAERPKHRKKSKPSFSSQKRAKEAKRMHSQKKNSRKGPKNYD